MAIFGPPSGTGRHHDHLPGETPSWIEWVTQHYRQVLPVSQVAVEFVTRTHPARRRGSIHQQQLVGTVPRAMETRICTPLESLRGTSAHRPAHPAWALHHPVRFSARHAGQIQRQPGRYCARRSRHQGRAREQNDSRCWAFPGLSRRHSISLPSLGSTRPATIFSRGAFTAAGRPSRVINPPIDGQKDVVQRPGCCCCDFPPDSTLMAGGGSGGVKRGGRSSRSPAGHGITRRL